jgi:hypothetical protein
VDVETPSGGQRQDRDGSGALHQRRRGRSTRGTLAELDLGGLTLFQWNVGLGRPGTSPLMTMTSSSLLDVLGGRQACVAGWRSPRRVNVLLQDAPFALKGANVSFGGAFTLFLA